MKGKQPKSQVIKLYADAHSETANKDEVRASPEVKLGRLLREHRLHNNLTLAEVAHGAEISSAMLSRIETGRTAASLDSLTRLSRALGITLASLFRELEMPIGGAQHIKKGEGLEVVRSGTKKGHIYELLAYSQGPNKLYEPFLITMDDASEVFPEFEHPGTEFIYMLEGKMEYHHGDKYYLLEPSDTLSFAGEVPHGPEKLIQVPIKFLAVIIYNDSTEMP